MRKLIYRIIQPLLALLIVAAIITTSLPKSEHAIRASSVKISSDKGSCSGEQIEAPSGIKYILTAAHCRVLGAKGSYSITTEGGVMIERQFVAEDAKSDLLLIEGVPGLASLSIAESHTMGQHIRTFTHGRGLNTYKSEGELIQLDEISFVVNQIHSDADSASCNLPKNSIITIPTPFGDFTVCIVTSVEYATNAFVAPGSSGGMVVDDSGSLVAVVSAGGDGFSYFVTLNDIQNFIKGY